MSGESVWIAWTFKPIFDTEGHFKEILCIGNDVTELKRTGEEKKDLETQLLRAQKMEAVGTLAGGIAHDFNNILQTIFSYSQILLMSMDETDPEYSKLKTIENSVRRASDLTKRLLIFSRRIESKLEPLDLNQEVVQITKMLERTIPKMIDIELRLAASLRTINGDIGQIEQIIMNLGVNARDAMPEGGKLIFETGNVTLDEAYCRSHLGSRQGDYVLLSVSDTGHGMDKRIVEHIFEPFYTTKEIGKGTGLGLAMVYGIVKSHHGYITCQSDPGRGTTFQIYFPVIEEITEEEVQETQEERIDIRGGDETILLVEDEEDIRELGKEILSNTGYKVLTAKDGETALEIYESEREQVDMVILDLIMPGMGGRRCLERLLKVNPQAKVVIASGYSVDNNTKEMIEKWVKGFVGKPYDIYEILKVTRDVLDMN